MHLSPPANLHTRACFFGAAMLVVLLALGAPAQQILAPFECETIEDGILLNVVPPERIPPVDNPQFVSAAEAEKFMSEDEPVLGLFDGQVAKAYSLWQLDRHEVVNDSTPNFGPIAVTW